MRALVDHGLPITRACTAVGISRSSFHYESKRTDDVELLERIKEIREKKPRCGYKRVHAKLRKEGFLVDHKRTERIWQAAQARVIGSPWSIKARTACRRAGAPTIFPGAPL